MDYKGFANIILIVVVVVLAGLAVYAVLLWQLAPPVPFPTPSPSPITECTSDSDCPSSKYGCEAIQGAGTAYPNGSSTSSPQGSQPSTFTIVKGVCKLKEGNSCRIDSDCVAGLLCHASVCARPIGRQCKGPTDTSCPADYECVQGCGSPVSRVGEPPPPYFCQLKGYVRNCPICLAGDTLIDTPSGSVPVKNLHKGMPIWTVNKVGNRIAGVVAKTSRVPVSPNHQMVQLVLDDGRTLSVSPGHPTVDGRTVGDLVPNDLYDGARVVAANRITYSENATYDILPSGETGFYWADGILLGSTLDQKRGN